RSDVAAAYMNDREQFGKKIAEFEGLQFLLADMAMEIEAARLLVYRAATLVEAHDPRMTYFAGVAKCYASDAAMKVTTDAVQILGGYGYMREYPVERFMRDAKITQIYEGTNQIQRVVIDGDVRKRYPALTGPPTATTRTRPGPHRSPSPSRRRSPRRRATTGI